MLESIKTETQTQGIVGMESWRPVQPALPAGPGERSDPRRASGCRPRQPSCRATSVRLRRSWWFSKVGLTARGWCVWFASWVMKVIVANPSKVRAISASRRKTDERDARCLAQLGRVDPELLCPVHPRSEEAQRALAVVRCREGLVRARTQLINQVRGTVKSFRSPPA